MEEIHIGYRTALFSPFVHTVRELGKDQYNLNIEVALILGTEQSEEELVQGEVDLLIGQHFTPFVSRVTGTNLTWLAIAQNKRDYKIVTRPGLHNLQELVGKNIGVANNPCLGINQKLVLDRMGLEDKVTIVDVNTRGGKHDRVLDLVAKGDLDGVFVDTPGDLEAKRKGLFVHEDTPDLDIIAGECITTIPKVITEKDASLKCFIKTYLHAVSIFKTKPDYVKELARKNPGIRKDLGHYLREGDEELFDYFLSHWRSRWEQKPYAKLKSLANAHEKATRYDARSAEVNPLTVVDMHYVKELDESGFIDQLYR